MSDTTGVVADLSSRAIREAFDVGLAAADGCMWVVIELDVGNADLRASISPADSEVLLRDLRGGVTPERIRNARVEAAAR